jgi:hypothetical protein
LLDDKAQEGAGTRIGVRLLYAGLAIATNKDIACVKTEDNIEEANGGKRKYPLLPIHATAKLTKKCRLCLVSWLPGIGKKILIPFMIMLVT